MNNLHLDPVSTMYFGMCPVFSWCAARLFWMRTRTWNTPELKKMELTNCKIFETNSSFFSFFFSELPGTWLVVLHTQEFGERKPSNLNPMRECVWQLEGRKRQRDGFSARQTHSLHFPRIRESDGGEGESPRGPKLLPSDSPNLI